MDLSEEFAAERTRLVRVAAGIMRDRHEAEDVVQLTWIRLQGTNQPAIRDLPAWLTTVTTRLCLDRLRARIPEPAELSDLSDAGSGPDPYCEVELADTVGVALHVVLEQLSPSERVAFVLHDTFGVEFNSIADILDSTPTAVRKLASRARARVRGGLPDGPVADDEVVDAFLAAAKGGDFVRLLHLLAPQVVVSADAEAIAVGTPAKLEGREQVAAMFDGAAAAALPIFVEGRAGAAWFHKGAVRVVFDFSVRAGKITGIVFRAAPGIVATVQPRRGADLNERRRRERVTSEPPPPSGE